MDYFKIYHIFTKNSDKLSVDKFTKDHNIMEICESYILYSNLEWFTYHNEIPCDICNNYCYDYFYVEHENYFSQRFVCVKCKTNLEDVSNKMIKHKGLKEYDKFIIKTLYLHELCNIKDIVKYINITFYELFKQPKYFDISDYII